MTNLSLVGSRLAKLFDHQFCSLREILLEEPVDFRTPMIVARVKLERPGLVRVRIAPAIAPARRFGPHRAVDFFCPLSITFRGLLRGQRAAVAQVLSRPLRELSSKL